ncbi:hypothetical protein CE91St36_24060 [Christensenellaceae bacterium]|nr:hypothetical protein CE91St36_24060 [Christensenellaceae bacterium]BDF62252.1 hypothetical protein CE91St37_24020 [Christensenellaceae bacterium]
MREQKSREQRNKLIDKGIELIRKHGVKDFSIRKIARECGMTPKGPYNYFEDANDFYNEIKNKILRKLMGHLYSDEILQEKDPVERFMKLEREYYSYYEQYFRLLSQIFIQTPMTQYYIEELGEIWRYVTDYPFLLDESEERRVTYYRHMVLSALLEGMPYTVDKSSEDGEERIRKIVTTALACMNGTIFKGGINDETRRA